MCVFDSSPLSTFRVMREKLDDRMQGSWWQGYGNDELNVLVDEAAGTADYLDLPATSTAAVEAEGADASAAPAAAQAATS